MDKNTDFSNINDNNLKKNNLEINNNVIFSEYIKITPYCSSYNLLNTKSEIKNNDIVAYNELINNDAKDYCNL